MKALDSRLLAWCGGLLLAVGAVGCRVEFPDDMPYACTETADCGGDGYVCAPRPDGGPRYCCLPDPAEACNGLDDDCDGEVDEDFDLKTDPGHCGACNNDCSSGHPGDAG